MVATEAAGKYNTNCRPVFIVLYPEVLWHH